MAYKRKSWREKLNDDKDLPRVVTIEGKMTKRWGTGTCVIPAPREVDALMKKVPKSKVITINLLRKALARKHNATIGCPITTGIFARIAAEVAAEEAAEGRTKITPYWRTLKEGGVINPKYPGGERAQKQQLEKEGLTTKRKGKKWVVLDFEKHLARLQPVQRRRTSKTKPSGTTSR
jgi:alkylated DNA nucleotide flippase Atl1